MKKLLLPIAMLLLGLLVGATAAYFTADALGLSAKGGHDGGAETAGADDAADTAPPNFVPAGKILVPLAFSDGRLSGYVRVTFALDVPEAQAATATARLPMLLHEINMRTWRTPLASGPDGLLADIGAFRKVVADSIPSAFGTDITVRNVAITEAVPA